MKRQLLPDKLKQLPYNFWLGFFITLLILSMSLISIVWTPHDITVLHIQEKFKLPGDEAYILGTDHFGRELHF